MREFEWFAQSILRVSLYTVDVSSQSPQVLSCRNAPKDSRRHPIGRDMLLSLDDDVRVEYAEYKSE